MKCAARLRDQRGLTLPELLVVSSILVTLLGLVEATFRYQTMSQRREIAKVATQGTLRAWLDRMVRDIRGAGYDRREQNRVTPTFTFMTASATQLTFTTDYDGDGTLDADSRENLGYRLNGDVLELWQGGSSWRPVLRGVTSLAFECFDAANPPRSFTCAATPASTRRSIAVVGITISAQAETGGVPGLAAPLITQASTAEVRNEIF